MKLFHYFYSNNPLKVDLCLEILNIFNLEDKDKEFVLDEIAKYIFDVKKTHKNGKKIFDFEQDYKHYFVDFYKIGINLNKQDIDWWEFDSLLAGFMISEDSIISKVIQYRTYEKPSKSIKTQEEQEHRYRMKMKQEYALKSNNDESINYLEKLWSYVEKKVGETKEWLHKTQYSNVCRWRNLI